MTNSTPSHPTDRPLLALADRILQSMLEHDPVAATYLGDHRGDGRLGDPAAAAADNRAGQLRAQLAELGALPPGPPDDEVDAAVLRTTLAAELLDLDDIREAEWNPMEHNPGGGLHSLLSRDYAPLTQRLDAVRQRLTAVPAYLAAARTRLGALSAIHVETALGQLEGTIALIDTELPAARAEAGSAPDLSEAAAAARAALAEHCRWLRERTGPGRPAQLGADQFARKLALTLDTAFEPERLLAQAEADLDTVAAVMVDAAARFAGRGAGDATTVRAVLDELASDVADDDTILGHCRATLDATREFVRARELVTVYDDPVVVVEMPEIDRGVAAAYCRENGPLEQATLPIEYAVSPTPKDWDREQIASFYREYNLHLLHNLTVHEAMPGHALQLMHANRHSADTRVRAVWGSGTFIEGWAAYTEQLMAQHGYGPDTSARSVAAVRIQQLKMQLRTILNTILDIRFHCLDLDEHEALRLMTERGFQEPSEAAGKWRRVQLTSTQLCTYYVGYTEVGAVADDLRAARPGWTERQVHDAMLAHGSPPARHLRTLLDLP